MPISCGRVVIDGYIYTINLEFRDDLGNVQTNMTPGPIDETQETPKELIKKINDIVAKVKESIQTSPSAKPLSSYKCIQINNAGIQLDGNELTWKDPSIEQIKAQWVDTQQTLGVLRAQLQMHSLPDSFKSPSTIVEFKVEKDGDASPSAATSATDPLDGYIDAFSFDDIGSNASENINKIWERLTENQKLKDEKTKVKVFLRIVNKLAGTKADKANIREAVLTKFQELNQKTLPSDKSWYSGIITYIFGANNTPQIDTWQPNSKNLAELAKSLEGNLGGLYDHSNPAPGQDMINVAPNYSSRA